MQAKAKAAGVVRADAAKPEARGIALGQRASAFPVAQRAAMNNSAKAASALGETGFTGPRPCVIVKATGPACIYHLTPLGRPLTADFASGWHAGSIPAPFTRHGGKEGRALVSAKLLGLPGGSGAQGPSNLRVTGRGSWMDGEWTD